MRQLKMSEVSSIFVHARMVYTVKVISETVQDRDVVTADQ